MWIHVSVLQEAVSTGDPELVQLVLQYRDFKRATERLAGIPELLNKLRQVPRPLSCSFGSKIGAWDGSATMHPILSLLSKLCERGV